MHDRDRRTAADEVDVVLDDDRRDLQLGDQLPYQLAGCRGLLGGHAGGGLVEQQKLGIIREQKPDLQPLALTVREMRARMPAWCSSRTSRSTRTSALASCPRAEASTASSMFSNTDRLSNTLGVWNLRPIPAWRADGQRGDALALVPDVAGARPEVTRDHADEGGLAGAVRPDDATQLAARELEIDVVGGDQALKPLGQPLGAQSSAMPLNPEAARRTGRRSRRRHRLSDRRHQHEEDAKRQLPVARHDRAQVVGKEATRIPPSNAPSSEARPPMATQTTTSVEKSTPASDGATKLAWVPQGAGGTRSRRRARRQRSCRAGAHAERDRSSFSRMPTSSLPKAPGSGP